MADPDEALIEAIAEAICESDSDWSEQSDRFKDAYRQYARAAYAALVAHLGLRWQPYAEVMAVDAPKRRLVSRWTEVDHGSE